MSENIELAIHYCCPFSQRALFTASYKGLNLKIVEVDLSDPSDWFLDLNPLCETPALKLNQNGTIYKMTESLNVSEYLESLPGPNLYPYYQGTVDPLSKAAIDCFIKKYYTQIFWLMSVIVFGNPTTENVREFSSYVDVFENNMEDGHYVMHKILGIDQITFADIMILPFIERFFAFKEHCRGVFDNRPGIEAWFKRISQEEWAKPYIVPERRLKKMYEIRMIPGEYRPLKLPVTFYDS